MSEDNIIAATAAGNPPNPTIESATPSNYDEIREDAEEMFDGEAKTEPTPQETTEKQKMDNLKKKLLLKLDGKEVEEEIDLSDEENLKKHLQKSKSFDKHSRESAAYRAQVEQFFAELQKDPEAMLEKLGMNVDEMAEKRLSRRVEELKKSPEQLEREKMQKELEDLRQEKKRAEEDRQKAELERMRNEQAQHIENDISGALEDSKSILPKNNPLVMQRIAQTMLFAMKNGYDNVTAKDVIPVVEKQWKEELNQFFSVVPEDVIEALVKKENLDRYRKKKLANRPKAETATPKQMVQDIGMKKEKEDEPKKKIPYRQFFSPFGD
jgi:hypothetical protein